MLRGEADAQLQTVAPVSRRVTDFRATTVAEDSLYTTTVVALCDDGTLWLLESKNESGERPAWRRLPDLPQGDDP